MRLMHTARLQGLPAPHRHASTHTFPRPATLTLAGVGGQVLKAVGGRPGGGERQRHRLAHARCGWRFGGTWGVGMREHHVCQPLNCAQTWTPVEMHAGPSSPTEGSAPPEATRDRPMRRVTDMTGMVMDAAAGIWGRGVCRCSCLHCTAAVQER